MPERILVTGGAGFVGSSLALAFKRNRSSTAVVALDNLKRRGSELALERLRAGGVEFVHGDVRVSDDLAAIGPVDILIEGSAEPSVHAGYDGNPNYVIHSNLIGAVNCLEHARRYGSDQVAVSTLLPRFAPCRSSGLQRDSFCARTRICQVLRLLAFRSDFRFWEIVLCMELRN